jgi:glycosyltransferase involved in cell wall biosynthesis
MVPEVLWTWMACAAIYALPARYEPFGLSVLEAALSACALVLGDIASLHENWDDVAVFVPPGDDAALANALLALAVDATRRTRMGLAARARARTQFGLDGMARAYFAAYQEIKALVAIPAGA